MTPFEKLAFDKFKSTVRIHPDEMSIHEAMFSRLEALLGDLLSQDLNLKTWALAKVAVLDWLLSENKVGVDPKVFSRFFPEHVMRYLAETRNAYLLIIEDPLKARVDDAGLIQDLPFCEEARAIVGVYKHITIQQVLELNPEIIIRN